MRATYHRAAAAAEGFKPRRAKADHGERTDDQVTSGSEALVRRFYEELWNRWQLAVADEILAEGFAFRGSLGATSSGRNQFKTYVERFRAAFPDWHNEVEELFGCGDRVAARLTWSGTHRGQFQDVEPTGKRVEYVGAGLFRIAAGRIAAAWIVGDTQELWRTLGRLQ
jgi:steroid delta-isomerase-like uncharacterized protein